MNIEKDILIPALATLVGGFLGFVSALTRQRLDKNRNKVDAFHELFEESRNMRKELSDRIDELEKRIEIKEENERLLNDIVLKQKIRIGELETEVEILKKNG